MTDPRRTLESSLVPFPLVAVGLLAAAVRVWFWLEARELPFFQHPSGDSATYVALAEQIVDQGWWAPLATKLATASMAASTSCTLASTRCAWKQA